MKYVILIHSNPQPWGHPTRDYIAEGQALPAEQHARWTAEFEADADRADRQRRVRRGRGAGRPGIAHLYRLGRRRTAWPPTARTPSPRSTWPGSSSSTCATRERAEEIAAQFAGARRHRRAPAGDVAGRRRPVTDPRARVAPKAPRRARRARAPLRRLRRCRGRRAGGAAGGRRQWPADGVPDNPTGWLITVASRRLIDQWRSDAARTDRERLDAARRR